MVQVSPFYATVKRPVPSPQKQCRILGMFLESHTETCISYNGETDFEQIIPNQPSETAILFLYPVLQQQQSQKGLKTQNRAYLSYRCMLFAETYSNAGEHVNEHVCKILMRYSKRYAIYCTETEYISFDFRSKKLEFESFPAISPEPFGRLS